ncbi:hypothetical protein [Streptomyces sp. Ru72]|uniref:hypothetical protein n=1 Tax=Streptomyces sp. Ru72 TaxID=2080747 RepID=UPI000CDDB4FB|nr:hypothetical protein [Streptomyces sp. Ru72]POX48956.1 hypothetical protein C3488_19110 [Streptomyces sp. Ru72]
MREDDGPEAGGEEEAEPEICDLCGAVVSDSTEWYALVRDSSAIHAVESKYDGKRMLVGCSREHLEDLVEQYKRRPFVDAELWAGKIARVLRRHPEGVSEEDLARESGLTHEQIQRGVMWQNTEAQRWLEQHSPDEDDSPGGDQ